MDQLVQKTVQKFITLYLSIVIVVKVRAATTDTRVAALHPPSFESPTGSRSVTSVSIP